MATVNAQIEDISFNQKSIEELRKMFEEKIRRQQLVLQKQPKDDDNTVRSIKKNN